MTLKCAHMHTHWHMAHGTYTCTTIFTTRYVYSNDDWREQETETYSHVGQIRTACNEHAIDDVICSTVLQYNVQFRIVRHFQRSSMGLSVSLSVCVCVSCEIEPFIHATDGVYVLVV